MKNKFIKITVAVLISIISPLTTITLPKAFADNPCAADPCSGSCTYTDEIKESVYGCTIGSDRINDAGNAVGTILSIIIGALGIVAVIFVVMGGIQYMTSAGDATKLKRAKDTILYACIGLAICVLSFAITQFAINAINSSTPATNNTSTP